MGKRKKKKKKTQAKVCGTDRRASQSLKNNPSLPVSEGVTLSGYTITPEPIKDYPYKIQKQVEEVHSIIRINPYEAIKQLEYLINKYPEVPVFCNYMAVAYEYIGDKKKVNFWTEENYRRHPNYLIARINIAEMYLRNKRLDEVEKILEGKFDLKLLYPERNKFHISVPFFNIR